MDDQHGFPDIEHLAKHDMMAALGMMAAGLAHEINTPLGAVRCTGSTLASAHAKLKAMIEAKSPELAADPEYARLCGALDEGDRILETSVQRVLMLVDKMRRFLARDCAEPVAFDLSELIDGTLLVMTHELKRRITVVRDEAELPQLHGFPDPVGQILLNLLLNAAQAIPGEGEITIRARAEGGHAVVEVRDDGPGVPAEIGDAIFDFGFTTKGASGGTGFGLALSRHLAGKLKGTLELDSPPDGGARFTLRFPLVLDTYEDGACPDGEGDAGA